MRYLLAETCLHFHVLWFRYVTACLCMKPVKTVSLYVGSLEKLLMRCYKVDTKYNRLCDIEVLKDQNKRRGITMSYKRFYLASKLT